MADLAIGFLVEVELDNAGNPGFYTEITSDLVDELTIKYGISGQGPTDVVAGTGSCEFALLNHPVRQYSPAHVDVLTGWKLGIKCRVSLIDPANAVQSVVNATRSGVTARLEVTGHGYLVDQWVHVNGASPDSYNGTYRVINVVNVNEFEYTMPVDPGVAGTGTITVQRVTVKHCGKIRVIDPVAGANRERRVNVISYDGMRDLAEADVREIDIVVPVDAKTEEDLFTDVINAVVSTSQPLGDPPTDFDTGVDTMPVAFFDIGPGVKALTLIKDVAVSSFSLVFMRGDGTLVSKSRDSRGQGTSAYTFTESEITDLEVPANLDALFNKVRVRIRPTTIDAAATTVLWESTGTPVEVPASGEITIWAEYRDPDSSQVEFIGGSEVVTPVASTHYSANTSADGTGTDITGDQTVTYTVYASTTRIRLQNANASPAFYVTPSTPGPSVNLLEVVGKGIYDLGAETYEADEDQPYGERPITIELRYQRSAAIAQAYADSVALVWKDIISLVDRLEYNANVSAALMTQAVEREPGDIVTLSEVVSGLANRDVVVHSETLTIRPGGILDVEYGLAPVASPFDAWILGVVGRSELGQTTIIGF